MDSKFDVGLMRGGAQPAEFGSLLARIAENPKLTLAGIYTHFHTYGGLNGTSTRLNGEPTSLPTTSSP